SFADVFSFQDEVATRIADALAIRLTEQERATIVEQETSVPAAYDAFLRGWEYYRRTTPEDFGKSIPHFEEAIRLDPNYARAHAALALVYLASDARGWSSALGIPSWTIPSRVAPHLQFARKHRTSTYYQAQSEYWRTAGYTSQDIAGLKQAIDLDPS